tara:strand:- start:169 stop:519 length:351 start_codon:yes stop_codon:yes gene_type:complete
MPPKKKQTPKARRLAKLKVRYDKEMAQYEIDVELWTKEFYEPIKEAFTAIRNERKLSTFDIESFIPTTDDIDDRTYAYEEHWKYLKAIEPDAAVILNVMELKGVPKPDAPRRPRKI